MDAAAAYNRLVEADPRGAHEQAQWLHDAFARAGITFDGHPMRTCLRPHFVPRGQWEVLRARGRRLMATAARVARTAFGPVELPVGTVTAILGGPFFLWLLFRRLA